MYHYEASGVGGVGVSAMGPGVPPGFSAINLSVKIAAAQAQRPRSPTPRDPRDPRPAIDLSTSSGSPQVRFSEIVIKMNIVLVTHKNTERFKFLLVLGLRSRFVYHDPIFN